MRCEKLYDIRTACLWARYFMRTDNKFITIKCLLRRIVHRSHS